MQEWLYKVRSANLTQRVPTSSIKKAQFYILTAVIIFTICLDVLLVKLPIYSITNRTTDAITGVFGIMLVVSIVVQILYLRVSFLKNKINFGFFKLSDKALKTIAIAFQSLIIALMIAVLFQIIFTDSYYTIFIKYIILLSTLLSIFFISLLLYRFISWFKVSKNSTLLFFSIATFAIIGNSIMIIVFSYFALLKIQQVMNPLIPSFTNMMFNLPALKNAYLSSTTVEFVLIWIASILILKPYSSKIGNLRFWSIMIVPIIFFVGNLQFYQSWLSDFLISSELLSPVSYFRFAAIFEVSTNVISALLFGVAYWVISRKISNNSLRQFVQISGIGICLLFLSSHISNLTLLPYPPFGLMSISFASVSSYLLFIGLYQSALITSRDSIIRSLIHKSVGHELGFIGNLGSSEMERNITSQFKQVIGKYGEEIIGDSYQNFKESENDIKGLVSMALQEREKYLRNGVARKLYEREESPLGRSWEKWVELWWQWCYSFPETNSPVTDLTGRYAGKGKIDDSVWFLAGTFGGKAERTCTIPKDNAIFFPILNNIISYYTDPFLMTQSDLRTYAKLDLDHTNFVSATIDGQDILNLNLYRIQSQIFSINVPNKLDKEPPVRTEAVSDGYWLFLKPLRAGKHKIEFKGEKFEFDKIENYQNVSADDIKGLPRFNVEVTYNINVI